MHRATLDELDRPIVADRLTLVGRVQGVGLRPAVARLAAELDLAGFVRNTAVGVEVEIEGPPEVVFAFCSQLSARLPRGAELDEIRHEAIHPQQLTTFEIQVSSPIGPLRTPVPPDRAVCGDCLTELARDIDRRYDYPFTSCTACGPRYSIIAAMPYDRRSTSMSPFVLCLACTREYVSPADRRFHAQTNSCPMCGPQIWASDASGTILSRRMAAIESAVAALEQGCVVVMRGVGGYQLLADATNAVAIRRLRERKQRLAKPLAVLVSSLQEAERLAVLNDCEQRALMDRGNPIVVVRRRREARLAPSVYEAFDTVGLMLPTTPLHWLVATYAGRPLVCTSGNREGEPLAYDESSAHQQLATVADCWLHHDRAVVRPLDDSVVRVMADRSVTLRLARGLAPLPVDLANGQSVLAVGGHQKSAIALSNGAQAMLGPHLGDLDNEAARQRFIEHVGSLLTLYDMRPELIVHDLHPDYYTTRWACEQGVPTMAVQHHHAHAAAAMLEQRWLDREVVAVTWDGTGFGPDGTIWGGEFLLATANDYRRVACCRSFRLPGGEAAVREPWRVVISLLRQMDQLKESTRLVLPDIDLDLIAQMAAIADHSGYSPLSSSIGRLFDAVAVIALGIRRTQFEGQPAMLLESACDISAPGRYPLPLVAGTPCELDWRPLVDELIADRARGASSGEMAMRFHRALAGAVVDVARRFPEHPVVLAGGVFQNRVLVELIRENWLGDMQPLGLPGIIPTGDGGLAVGQLAIALARLKNGGVRACV